MKRKVTVIIELDEDGFYAWTPELKGCHTQGESLEEVLSNMREAVELYLDTLTEEEICERLSKEVLTTALEVSIA